MIKELPKRRVVVTGYGMVTPLGKNTKETFDNAEAGLSGIDNISSFETSGLPCKIGGQVKDKWLDTVNDHAAGRFYKFSSRGLKLIRAASLEAAEQANLKEINDRTKIGVSLGYHGDNPSIEDVMFLHQFYNDNDMWDTNGLLNTGGYSYLNFLRRKPDVVTSILSILNNCKGPNLSIVSACAAGSQAIGEAYRIIQEGRASVMLAGGCDATLNLLGFIGFVLIKALVERYATPQQASRPFDRKRNGFVMSEGAGAVVLEDMDHAIERGAPILGEIIGYGSSADAYRITDIHPKGLGAVMAMQNALNDADITPEHIEYINAHGTSTVQNDLTETLAIKQVFGERAKNIPTSSNKSMLGHTIGAAGAIECILTLEGMKRSVILPTINYEFPDPKCDLDYVPNTARQQKYTVALSNSFGFGGQNACLCLKKFDG
jgi:3-oxoacyl-[acyl-carrier-protein] synthase II